MVATTALLVAILRDTSSTAGIGMATIPMVLYPVTAGVLAVDRLLSARPASEADWRGFVRRLLAAVLSFVVIIAAISTWVRIFGLFDPVTRDDLAGSLISTVVSAAATAAGALAIKRLWRTPPSPQAPDPPSP